MARSLFDEADHCRKLVSEVRLPAEKDVLMRIAHEFDRLAQSAYPGDRRLYEARAAQEVKAAVASTHPRARSAHLTMARHYDALAR